MDTKLFRREMDPRCAYCQFASTLNDRECMCVKRGVVPMEHHCRAFRYDPLRREPPRPATLKTDTLQEKDFTL